ncbi:MAG TPA: hypothetical protein VF911_14640, partial [Thermoanaerobaculia bacterium]
LRTRQSGLWCTPLRPALTARARDVKLHRSVPPPKFHRLLAAQRSEFGAARITSCSEAVLQRLLLLTLFLIFTVSEARAASSATIQVHLQSNAIVAEGVSPKGEVILVGVSHESAQYKDIVRHWQRVTTDDDSDGRVTFTLDAPIQQGSIWVVADVRTARYGVATPDGMKLPDVALASPAFRKGATGDVAALELARASALIVVVRQGAGAWRLHVEQDGKYDEERGDHAVMRVSPGSLKPLAGNAPPPPVLTPGDLLLVLEPFKLEFVAVRVPK